MRTIILLTLFCLSPIWVFTQNSRTVKNDSITLKVLIPDFRQRNYDYLNMLLTSFKYYFHDGLAFENKKDGRIRVEIRIKGDTSVKLNLLKIEDAIATNLVSNNRLTTLQGFPMTKNFSYDATVILLNTKNETAYIDSTYRAQGEQLKVLELKVKELLEIEPPLSRIPFSQKLKVGDFAPDVCLVGSRKLSERRGSVVVLSFYPAAFSGNRKLPSSFTFTPLISCVGQIESLAKIPPFYNIKDISSLGHEIYAITSSTDALIQLWRVWMAKPNIRFINDADYYISKSFNSYHASGFNNRFTYIIGKDGRILYISPNFDFGDEAEIHDIIVKEIKKY